MLFSAAVYLSGLALLSASAVRASSTGANATQACLQSHSTLGHGTYQLTSDCAPAFYCASNGTCANKGCRREEFPAGYPTNIPFPPFCKSGTFCPDEGDQCLSLLTVDSPCQLNRDDECAPPPNQSQLTGPRNTNGSVCLNYQCMWANATSTSHCVVENIPYIVYDQVSEKEYINIVSRDNCVTGQYCDTSSKICTPTLAIGVTCTADKECGSDNCDLDGKCGQPISASKHVSTWVYAVVGAGIIGGMLAVFISLFLFHRKRRNEEQTKRAQYWREQEAYRNNILSMREQARASILSLPWQSNGNTPRGGNFRDSDYPESTNSQTGMLYAAGKSSGLRNGFSDDDDNNDSRRNSMEENLVSTHDDDDEFSPRRHPSDRS